MLFYKRNKIKPNPNLGSSGNYVSSRKAESFLVLKKGKEEKVTPIPRQREQYARTMFLRLESLCL